MDLHRFYNGTMYDAYEHLGCHTTAGGADFTVYAPSAVKVTVKGDFSAWEEIPMTQDIDGRFFCKYIEGASEGMFYKYVIYTANGHTEHCDPYGFAMEKAPGFASVIYNRRRFKFSDDEWMKNRTDCKKAPLNIYEVHLGSWRDGIHSYRELADALIPYVSEKGYNYIEFMPLCEHPCDESWGYQITGFFSPTSRYGTPDDLKYLVDRCHRAGIGVLLDFVPVHFAVDYYGLAYFDGSHLYEYQHNDIGYNEWGSKNFNHSKGEVSSFLISAANYWLSEYHFDGIRVDALSNMIYWQGNIERSTNERAIAFIRTFTSTLKGLHPTAILAAEDSTSYPGVTRPVREGGLGFDYKWDMGWMNDTLDYFRMDTNSRKAAYHKLTFSMYYFYNESYILPLSHDEVVHGKATIVQKMNGAYEKKFPQARAMYMYMYAHPGKKLNFMGNELAQLREWDESRGQDFDVLKYPAHDSFCRFMQDLSKIYLSSPMLSELDYDNGGFKWIDCEQDGTCAYALERYSEKAVLVALFNFGDTVHTYEFNESCSRYELILDSDHDIYGGSSKFEKTVYTNSNGKIQITLPPFSAKYFLKH